MRGAAACVGGSSRATWSLQDKRFPWNDRGCAHEKARKWSWRATVSCSRTESCNGRCRKGFAFRFRRFDFQRKEQFRNNKNQEATTKKRATSSLKIEM